MLSSAERTTVDPSEVLAERVDALVAWIQEMDSRLRTAEVATGDEKTAKELRKAIEAIAKHDPKLQDRLTNHVDVLTDRLATIATTVSTTAAALAAKDGEIAGLRRELEQGNVRIEALVSGLGRSANVADVDELRKAIGAFAAQRPGRTNDEQVEQLIRKVDFLTERVDTLATTVATTAGGLAGRDGELAAIRRKLDDEPSRVSPAPVGDLLQQRLDALAARVAMTKDGLDSHAGEMATVKSRLEEETARVETAIDDLGKSLGALATKVIALDNLPPEVDAQALDERFSGLNAHVDGLSARLDELAASVGSAVEGVAGKELELAALHRHFEEVSARVDSLVADLREALETMPTPATADPELEGNVAELAGAVTELSGRLERIESAWSGSDPEAFVHRADLEPKIDEIGDRLASIERDRGAAAAELAHTTVYWSAELGSIEARVTELTELRVLMEGLRTRLASGEEELAALSESRHLVERIDELASRLESLETSEVSAPPDPVEGDGRFRVELRGLELRMEHAEVAARENREAVLVQLERLASRFEWRLHNLESDHASLSAAESVAGGGQVVPLRGGDA